MFAFAGVALPTILLLLLLMTSHLAAETASPLNANGVRLHGEIGEKILVTSAAFKKAGSCSLGLEAPLYTDPTDRLHSRRDDS